MTPLSPSPSAPFFALLHCHAPQKRVVLHSLSLISFVPFFHCTNQTFIHPSLTPFFSRSSTTSRLLCAMIFYQSSPFLAYQQNLITFDLCQSTLISVTINPKSQWLKIMEVYFSPMTHSNVCVCVVGIGGYCSTQSSGDQASHLEVPLSMGDLGSSTALRVQEILLARPGGGTCHFRPHFTDQTQSNG